MISKTTKRFIHTQALSGLLLFAMLLCALLISNSTLLPLYNKLADLPIGFQVGNFLLTKPLLLWVNEGLMAIFFMLLALEMKREILEGELNSLSKIALPFIAAIGGITFPAIIYLLFNQHNLETIKGWPVAITTDIAFVLGIVSLLGSRVPPALKAFLVALSIVDDILAVIIIAIFYTNNLSYIALAYTGLAILALLICNLLNVRKIAIYILIGIFMWFCVIKSNIHATLAGVIVGLFIPLHAKDKIYSPLRRLEKILHPWVAFMILPLFVFMNGGIDFHSFGITQITSPVFIGVSLGLIIGKGLGVFCFSWLLIQMRIAHLPDETNYRQLLGISVLTGIGFTMSLFLAALAFFDTPYENIVRQSIVIGSLISAIIGIMLLLKKDSNATVFFIKKNRSSAL